MRKTAGNILVVFMALTFYSNQANAMFDVVQASQKVVDTVQGYVATVETKVSAVTTKVHDVYTAAKNKYEMAKKKVADKFASLSPNKNGDAKPLSTMKDLESSSILSEADQKDPAKVAEVIHQLFMAYPSDDPIVMAAYRRKAEEFWIDTLVEMYVVVHALDDQVAELEKTIDGLSNSQDLAGGDAGGDDSEQEIPARTTEYNALDAFNDLAKMSELLATLRAQYESARHIKHYIVPKEYDPKAQGKSSSFTLGQKVYANAVESFHLSFAAIELKNNNKALAKETSLATSSTINKVAVKGAVDNTVNKIAVKGSVGNVKTMSGTEKNDFIKAVKATAATAGSDVAAKGNENAAETKKKGPQPFGGYVYDVKANSTIKYGKAADPKLESAYSGSDKEFEMLQRTQEAYDMMMKAVNVHNIKQALPSYKNVFDSYHDIVYQHVMAIANVQESDKCAIKFLSNYYRNPESVWYGSSNLSNPTDYEARKGISGWAYTSFQAGKVLVADNELVSENAVASSDYELKEDDEDGVSDVGTFVEDTGKIYSDKHDAEEDSKDGTEDEDEDNDSGLVPGLASQTDAAKIKQNVRLREKFTFLIGSEIAQKLAADQYGAQRWGRPYRKFKIWNDQKSFYDVYLDKKYKNMVDYIKEVSYLDFLMEMVDVSRKNYNNDDEGVEGRVRSELKTTYNYYQAHKTDITNKLDASNKFKQLVEERKKVLAAMQKTFETQKSGISASIERTRKTLDEVLAQIDVAQEKIDEQQKIVSDAKAQIKQSDSEEESGKKRMAQSTRNFSAFVQNAVAAKAQQLSEKAKAEAQLKTLKIQMKALCKQQENLEKEIQNKKKALVDLSDKFETEYMSREKFYEDQIMTARKNKLDNGDVYTTHKIYSDFMNHQDTVVNGILHSIDGSVLSCVKKYAIKQIEDAKKEVDALNQTMGDGKYTAAGAEEIKKIHKKMMDRFKPEVRDIMDTCGDLEAYYVKGIAEVIKGALYKKICPENKCLNSDEEYFVGVAPVERDFFAAHKMAEGALPPVREIVYFDHEEYIGMQKKNKLVGLKIYKKLNRQEVGEHLTQEKKIDGKLVRVPEIWEKMLDPHAYVEVGYDLSVLGIEGNEVKASADDYVRGGIYPCKLRNDLYLDLGTDEGNTTVFKLSSTAPSGAYNINLPDCQEIGAVLIKNPKTMFNPAAGGMVRNYDIQLKSTNKAYTLYDKVYPNASWSRRDGVAEMSESDMKENTAQSSSELAMLISYIEPNPPAQTPFFIPQVKDGLVVVSRTPANIFKRMKREEEEDKNGKVSFYTANNYRAQMKRNQIGDFLTMVEREQELSQGESELREKIESLRTTLIESLKTAGIDVREDIDLSDIKQYLSLSQKLDNAKTKLLAQLSNEVIKLTMDLKKDNALLDEKMLKLNAVRRALLKDHEALVIISDSSDGASPEFEQAIKSAKANEKASNKYKEEADANKAGRTAPYCASYPIF